MQRLVFLRASVALLVSPAQVVGSTFQQMDSPSSRTYIGSGKVEELAEAVKVMT